MEKIAIIIPTIHRDKILMETINSILDVWQENWIILIGDQNNIQEYSDEKRIFYSLACAEAHHTNPSRDKIQVIPLPYDCGLSYARNKLVEKAHELGIKYCLISADSIKFTESMQYINEIIRKINYSPEFNIDLIGLNLKNRTVGWEAWLDLQESFVLDFIDKQPINALLDKYCESSYTIWKCDIVRNFFLATTESLSKTKWDENLKMMEHEDFFWRYKQDGFKVGWTNLCNGEYTGKKDGEYAKLRAKNMNQSKEYLMKKHNLKSWVTYINLDRARGQAD